MLKKLRKDQGWIKGRPRALSVDARFRKKKLNKKIRVALRFFGYLLFRDRGFITDKDRTCLPSQ